MQKMSEINLIKTEIDGVFIVKCQQSFDSRGRFVKNYNAPLFEKNGINFICRESFCTTSQKNVIRGMHFQSYPFSGYKLVTLFSGRVLDVILDLRNGSKTRGKYITVELNANNADAIIMPPDCAHGFLALEDNCMLHYQTETEYSAVHDCGILYNSFGFDWPCASPIISTRDKSHPTLSEYFMSENQKK